MAPVFDFDKNIVINNSVNDIENEKDDNLTDYNGSGDEYNCTFCYMCNCIKDNLYEFTSNINVCEECLVTYEISDYCICCKDEISFVQKEYIITSLDIFNKCIYCLSKDDEKIKNDYIEQLTLEYNNNVYFKYWLNEANGIKSKNNSEMDIFDVDNFKNEENINPQDEKNNENNIIKVDTLYEEITEDIRDILISKEIEAYDELHNKYNFDYNNSKIISEKLEYIYVAHKLGYEDLTRNTIMNIFEKILLDFEIDFNYISFKEDNNVFVLYNKEKEVKNVDVLDDNSPENDDDLYFINLKHKKLNYKLLQFLNKTKIIKNNKPPSIESNFYKNIKVKSIELRNNIKNDVLSKYNSINDELNLIQKEIDEMEKVLPIYDKLKENKNILEIQNEGVNDLQKLFIKLKNDKINEYTTMSNIGKNIIDNNINNNEIKEILIGYNKDRINRIIIKCKRISILSNYVNINILANSGISHFLRDSNEESFNKLIYFIKTNPL